MTPKGDKAKIFSLKKAREAQKSSLWQLVWPKFHENCTSKLTIIGGPPCIVVPSTLQDDLNTHNVSGYV